MAFTLSSSVALALARSAVCHGNAPRIHEGKNEYMYMHVHVYGYRVWGIGYGVWGMGNGILVRPYMHM